MDVPALVDVEWYLDIYYVVDYRDFLIIDNMTTETLNRANKITEELKELNRKLFIASREATRFAIILPETDDKFMVEDNVLTTKLLMTACDYYDAEIARLNKELKDL